MLVCGQTRNTRLSHCMFDARASAEYPLFTVIESVTGRWSYGPLVLRVIGPTGHWSYGPLVLRQGIICLVS